MGFEPGNIPVNSEPQAMEWSLVLVSQGMEATILAPAEDHGWLIRVEPESYARALRVLRVYHTENRAPAWVRPVPGTGLLFDARSLAWMFLLFMFFAFTSEKDSAMRAAGIMDPTLVRHGQWWRLFTAVTLHGDLGHLAANLSTGFLLLGLAMGGVGPGFAVLASFLAGACGNLAGLFLHQGPYHGLGASGMVMGALGLLSVTSVAGWRAGLPAAQLLRRGLAGGLLLLMLFGLDPRSDVIAHVGGFVGGLILGGLLVALPPRWIENTWANRAAEVACALLIMIPWWLALRGASHRGLL